MTYGRYLGQIDSCCCHCVWCLETVSCSSPVSALLIWRCVV